MSSTLRPLLAVCCAVLAPSLTACGGDADVTSPVEGAPSAAVDAREPDVSTTTCAEDLSSRDLQEHACLHAQHGPFATVSASRPASAPSVARSHTAYEVLFPADDERWVSYRAKEAGLYAFYSGPETRLALRTASGDRVVMECEGPTTDVCPALPYQVQARIEAGSTIYMALFPASADEIQLVVEHVD